MSVLIKSFSVYDENGEQGDMYYIKHGSSNFTIIDCCIVEDNKYEITQEINNERTNKGITRFISTHPDEDHICGLKYLDDKIDILNFYCVENDATKSEPSESFEHYCKLRDDTDKHFYVYKNCKRKWLNDNDGNDGKNYGSSGINFLWPITSNSEFKSTLKSAKDGKTFNNISPIFTYSYNNSVTAMWMGDLEHDFLEKIKDQIVWGKIDILFAPHHGRDSGKVPEDVLKKLDPKVVVIGEAPSKHLNYYPGYNTITQNSAKNIVFECETGKIHIFVSNKNYTAKFLKDENKADRKNEYYIGSFDTHS